jgi:hypothetical protein
MERDQIRGPAKKKLGLRGPGLTVVEEGVAPRAISVPAMTRYADLLIDRR